MNAEVLFTRSVPIAQRIERLLGDARTSIDCALYRLGNATLANRLREAAGRGVRVRVVLDRGKVKEGISRPDLLGDGLSCRLSSGRSGAKSKMHHKFAVLDQKMALTGSYNWSEESEKDNYENLVILRESAVVEAYIREFELLWKQASEADVQP
jgi:phosphatidylserine/phosphatidylglycerophosphate/cardiolipin synthase-like enzyme